ncbi:hypothetical protein [Alkalihalobacillus sp. LMS39]|uniref:hypothetical protein n=1 Tax=Alkalihalobacillus sp. LMS39 TaxID=2924032 RepID=UPI001FB37CEA|nr:hypothetical protein [Alkalihalobacillus sp. LMS39]UOE95076.1 hypothetical protein MM271_05435 [Alkalihalobacillus sp. LMS39]
MDNNVGECRLHLKRTSQFINRLRNFKIYIDNVHVKDIGDGKEVVIPIDKGQHTLHIAIDWVKSEKLEIDIDSGELELMCGSPLTGVKLFIPFITIIGSFVPKWYLFIKKA